MYHITLSSATCLPPPSPPPSSLSTGRTSLGGTCSMSYHHSTLFSPPPFFWCYNPLWVLAFSVIFFHFALSLHNLLRPLAPIICIQSSISSIHLFLGLPLILLPVGFHSNILLGVLSFHPSTSRDRAKLFFCFL
jgi:hypothetical protein